MKNNISILSLKCLMSSLHLFMKVKRKSKTTCAYLDTLLLWVVNVCHPPNMFQDLPVRIMDRSATTNIWQGLEQSKWCKCYRKKKEAFVQHPPIQFPVGRPPNRGSNKIVWEIDRPVPPCLLLGTSEHHPAPRMRASKTLEASAFPRAYPELHSIFTCMDR